MHARLNAANEVGEGGVLDQTRQLAAVRCGHQLHAPLRDAPGRQSLSLSPNLVLRGCDCLRNGHENMSQGIAMSTWCSMLCQTE